MQTKLRTFEYTMINKQTKEISEVEIKCSTAFVFTFLNG